jgi:D-glycero-D-manno-heptose 1,7-bisphosphate phosphatase
MLTRAYRATHTPRVVFLDRDGVVNERRPLGYVLSWEQFRFRRGAVEALAPLAGSGLSVVIVSNQSCISQSLVSREEVATIMDSMSTILISKGIMVAAWYCCPHIAEDACLCRKPKPGMILSAANDLAVSVSDSYLIGDKQWDLDAGVEAGCRISIEVDEHDITSLELAVRAVCADARTRSLEKANFTATGSTARDRTPNKVFEVGEPPEPGGAKHASFKEAE